MEIVLANGEILKTGFGHYDEAQATYLFLYGVGPYLDGIFTQSNFGIVTRLGLWLMPAYECMQHYLCMVEAHEDIQAVVDSLRPLRLDGTLRSAIHIGNDLKVISGENTYPLVQTGGRVPLSSELRQSLRHETGAGAWTVSGALYGRSAQVALTRRLLKQALNGHGRTLMFLSERKLEMGAYLVKWLGNSTWGRQLKAKLETGRALFDMNRGIPNGKFLAGAYDGEKVGGQQISL